MSGSVDACGNGRKAAFLLHFFKKSSVKAGGNMHCTYFAYLRISCAYLQNCSYCAYCRIFCTYVASYFYAFLSNLHIFFAYFEGRMCIFSDVGSSPERLVDFGTFFAFFAHIFAHICVFFLGSVELIFPL